MWIVISAAAMGCQIFEKKDPTTTPHPQLEHLWRGYEKLSDYRALAIAGDPERRWVAGASSGHATPSAAREAALEECRKRRQRQRMREVCRIYAEGPRIVWGAP